jgi:hypothetical protein
MYNFILICFFICSRSRYWYFPRHIVLRHAQPVYILLYNDNPSFPLTYMNNTFNYGDPSFVMLAWWCTTAKLQMGLTATRGTTEEWFRYFRFSQHPLVKLKMMAGGCRRQALHDVTDCHCVKRLNRRDYTAFFGLLLALPFRCILLSYKGMLSLSAAGEMTETSHAPGSCWLFVYLTMLLQL